MRQRILDKQDVIDILLNKDQLTYRKLAEKYNISSCLVSNIRRGKAYADVAPDIKRVKYGDCKRLPLWLKQAIKNELSDEDRVLSVSEIARRFGIPVSYAFLIKKGSVWKNVFVD